MKKKIFALLALVCMTLTASADVVPTYALTKATDAEAHGTITFKVGENTVTSAAEGQTVTVVITPNTGWVVNQPSGQWYAAVAKAPRRTAGIDMLKDFELTKLWRRWDIRRLFNMLKSSQNKTSSLLNLKSRVFTTLSWPTVRRTKGHSVV